MTDHREEVEQLLAEYRRSREQLAGVQQRITAISESASSDDGLITATVGGRGVLTDLTIADGAYERAVAVVEPTRTNYHVAYRVVSRHPLGRGAAGRAIMAGRDGDPSYTASSGELEPGAQGVAAPLVGAGVEASIGVVALGERDASVVGPQVVSAAEELTLRLS